MMPDAHYAVYAMPAVGYSVPTSGLDETLDAHTKLPR